MMNSEGALMDDELRVLIEEVIPAHIKGLSEDDCVSISCGIGENYDGHNGIYPWKFLNEETVTFDNSRKFSVLQLALILGSGYGGMDARIQYEFLAPWCEWFRSKAAEEANLHPQPLGRRNSVVSYVDEKWRIKITIQITETI